MTVETQVRTIRMRPTPRQLFWICALPLVWLLVRVLLNDLGDDPAVSISEFLGQWAVRFLLITLAVTPVADLTKNAWLTRHRRLFGLYAFFYSSLHFLTYLVDFNFILDDMLHDIFEERDTITVGILAFVLMLPLTVTSNNRSMRKMGAKAWKRLHWLTFPAAAQAVYHHYLMVLYINEEFPLEAYIYTAILVVLICYRLFSKVPNWITISETDAKAHELYGFGGWLYALYGFAFVRLLLNMNNIHGDQTGMIGMYGADNVATMHIAMDIQSLCLMVFLLLAPMRHHLMPKVATIAFALGVATLFIAMMTLQDFPPNRFGAVVINHGLTALLYALYLQKSKRVNVTYLNRVSKRD